MLGADVRLCRESNGVDFDDLLGITVAMLRAMPEIKDKLQMRCGTAHYHPINCSLSSKEALIASQYMSCRWRHILVDEFQDTNAAQYEFVLLLQSPGSGTFVVGDPDQV